MSGIQSINQLSPLQTATRNLNKINQQGERGVAEII
jgi:hypothetical protein